jgi:hypothetical protein
MFECRNTGITNRKLIFIFNWVANVVSISVYFRLPGCFCITYGYLWNRMNVAAAYSFYTSIHVFFSHSFFKLCDMFDLVLIIFISSFR